MDFIQFFIEFKRPKQAERRELWEKMIPKEVPLSDDVDSRFLDTIACKYKFCGGEIADVVYRACATAAMRGEDREKVPEAHADVEKLMVTKQDISLAAQEESQIRSRDCEDLLGRLFI